ncbi:hypothetical protein, partial [Aeromonas sp. 601115]|uniref:hypothetical protein n=1 Tax=Aeromonas sp. 601115 TaxID=2712038 RepID=UPI003BA10795
QHHSITASQHHSITASQHHSITASQKNGGGWLRQMNPSYQTRHHGLVRGSKRVGDIELRVWGRYMVKL